MSVNVVQNGCDLVSDLEAKHFPPAVRGDADCDDNCLGDDPPADAGLAVGRVEEHIR